MDFIEQIKAALVKGGFTKDELRFLETAASGKVYGTIVSDKFKGMESPERYEMVWKAIDSNLADAHSKVVTLLSLTCDEHEDYAAEA